MNRLLLIIAITSGLLLGILGCGRKAKNEWHTYGKNYGVFLCGSFRTIKPNADNADFTKQASQHLEKKGYIIPGTRSDEKGLYVSKRNYKAFLKGVRISVENPDRKAIFSSRKEPPFYKRDMKKFLAKSIDGKWALQLKIRPNTYGAPYEEGTLSIKRDKSSLLAFAVYGNSSYSGTGIIEGNAITLSLISSNYSRERLTTNTFKGTLADNTIMKGTITSSYRSRFSSKSFTPTFSAKKVSWEIPERLKKMTSKKKRNAR